MGKYFYFFANKIIPDNEKRPGIKLWWAHSTGRWVLKKQAGSCYGCIQVDNNKSQDQSPRIKIGPPLKTSLNLTQYSKIKDALFFKMFIYMYKKDFPQKNIFFFALTGRPEAIYFAL